MHFAVNPPVVAAHLLALFLIVVGPIWDHFELRPLKAQPTSRRRLRYYRLTFIWLWIATGVACWINGLGALTTLHGLGIQVEWLQCHLWAWWLSIVFVSLFVLLQLVFPVVQVSIKYRNRPFLEPRQFEPLRFFLPSSRLERRWWVALSLTAAFCEEVLFRGFLLRYLHTSPWRLGLVWASLFAAAVFGAHHLYQGAKGLVG